MDVGSIPTASTIMACELCNRSENVILDEHHLIPKTLHSSKWYKKNFSKEELKNSKILVCRDCHDAIHQFIPEKELGKNYNTKEKLLGHEKVAGFVKWIATKKAQFSKAHKD